MVGNSISSFISIMVKKVCYSQNSAYQQQSCGYQTDIIGASRSIEQLKVDWISMFESAHKCTSTSKEVLSFIKMFKHVDMACIRTLLYFYFYSNMRYCLITKDHVKEVMKPKT